MWFHITYRTGLYCISWIPRTPIILVCLKIIYVALLKMNKCNNLLNCHFVEQCVLHTICICYKVSFSCSGWCSMIVSHSDIVQNTISCPQKRLLQTTKYSIFFDSDGEHYPAWFYKVFTTIFIRHGVMWKFVWKSKHNPNIRYVQLYTISLVSNVKDSLLLMIMASLFDVLWLQVRNSDTL